MKSALLVGAGLLAAAPVCAQVAQPGYDYGYSYTQDRINQGYISPTNAPYATTEGNTSRAPTTPQAYGFYLKPPSSKPAQNTDASQMMWYPTQQQRVEAGYGTPYYAADSGWPDQPAVYNSPVYNSMASQYKRRYYAGLHLGIGGTLGWKGDLDNPVGAVWGITVGTRLSPTVRVDAEFSYHTEAKLASEGKKDIKYKQYDLGANVYYDFPVHSNIVLKPFVGAGIWAVKGKASGRYQGTKISAADSSVKLGLSVAGGVTYPINDMFTLYAMARARYIAADDALYNLEGLFGVRYSF